MTSGVSHLHKVKTKVGLMTTFEEYRYQLIVFLLRITNFCTLIAIGQIAFHKNALPQNPNIFSSFCNKIECLPCQKPC